MLMNEVILAITAIITLKILKTGRCITSLQKVRDYLETVFPEWWIRKRRTIESPVRSPNLTSLPYFL